MTAQQDPQLVVQEIFGNVRAGGNITVGDITQIYQIISNLGNLPQPTGFPQNIPPSSIDKFVGRGKEIECLHQQLQQKREVIIAAVEGMGGVGKTELAIQYSLLHLQLNSYSGGICWLRAREQDIGLQIVEFARTDLGLQPPEDLELPQRVRWCWKHWHQGNKLIVLDDVKDYGQIKPFLPPQPSQFKVIITTRLKLDKSSSLFLEVLDETAALELLAQLVGEEKLNQELATGKELCQRLGYLPLALQLIGRYVQKRRITLAEMLRRLDLKGLGHSSLVVNKNDPTCTLNIERGVTAAFELSWSELTQLAQQLGCLLSLFALAPIPWSLVESTTIEQDSEALENARVELENLHLLQGEDPYQLHQLIREFLRVKQNELADADEQKCSFCQAIVEVAKGVPESPNQKEISTLTPGIPHLEDVAQNLTDAVSNENLIEVLSGLYRFYSSQGLYALAEPWCEQCVLVIQTRLGEEHHDVAKSYNNQAELYRFQGRYDEAEDLYEKALSLNKRLFGEEHPDVAFGYNSLAALYHALGRYDEAEHLCRTALSIRERLFKEDHHHLANSYNRLATIYHAQGRYDEAGCWYKRALSMRQRLFNEDHSDVANSYNNLAALYKSQGRYVEAEDLFNQALQLRQRLLGKEHPSVATSYNNLAALYKSQGRYAEAEDLFNQAMQLRQRRLGEEHPDVIISYNNLALFYESQGRYAEAEDLFLRALEIAELNLGVNHPNTMTIHKNLRLLRDNRTF